MKKRIELLKKGYEDVFSDHIVELHEIGDVTILDFFQPDVGFYRIRYIFNQNFIYISGDLGVAVFDLTWDAEPYNWQNINYEYMLSKLRTIEGGLYEFNENAVYEKLNEVKSVYIEKNKDDETALAFIDDFIRYADTSSRMAWSTYIDRYQYEIQQYLDSDFYWMYDAGKTITNRAIAYIKGLQMAENLI